VRRRERLSGRRQFAAVRAERVSAGSVALRVHLKANGLAHARVGFAIPRAAGGAVQRNILRRRLRAALAPRRVELAGYDVVVSASAAALQMRFADLESELWRCLGAARGRLAENGTVRPGPRRAPMPAFA
jgi:ribonuclease P protein component